MKRAANLWTLVNRCTPWLCWWQELLLNWVASWKSIGTLVVISADGEDQCQWNVPSDLDLQKMELEELMDRDPCDT
jgi:hypothetical protein